VKALLHDPKQGLRSQNHADARDGLALELAIRRS